MSIRVIPYDVQIGGLIRLDGYVRHSIRLTYTTETLTISWKQEVQSFLRTNGLFSVTLRLTAEIRAMIAANPSRFVRLWGLLEDRFLFNSQTFENGVYPAVQIGNKIYVNTSALISIV